MPLTAITVTYGANGLVGPNGSAASGAIVMTPVQETPDPGYTIVVQSITFTVTNGQIAAPNTLYTNGQAGLQMTVYEQIIGAKSPAPYVVSVPTSGTLDLSQAPRTPATAAPVALFIPSSVVTAAGDLIVGTAAGAVARLAVGATGQVLTADSTQTDGMKWANAGTGSVTSVAAADGTIVIGGTPTVAPTVKVGAIAESQVTNLTTDLAGKVTASTVTTKGDLLAATGSAAITRLGVGNDGQVLTAASGQSTGLQWATPATYKPTIRSAWIANASDATLPNTAGVWQALSGFELDLPASVGQWVEIGVHAMRSNTSSAFLDIAVIVGTTLVRYLSSGTATPGIEGDPGFYFSNGFTGQSAGRGFIAGVGDIDTGTVRFVVAVKAQGAGTLYSSTSYPFYWAAKNLGAPN